MTFTAKENEAPGPRNVGILSGVRILPETNLATDPVEQSHDVCCLVNYCSKKNNTECNIPDFSGSTPSILHFCRNT